MLKWSKENPYGENIRIRRKEKEEMLTGKKIGNAEWGLSMDGIFLTVSDIKMESEYPISLENVLVQWDRRLILSTPESKYTKEIYDLITKIDDSELEIDFEDGVRSGILYVDDLKKAKLGLRDIDLTNSESFWKYQPPLISTKVKFVPNKSDRMEIEKLKQGHKMLLKDVVYNLKIYPLLPELSGTHKGNLIVTNLDKVKWVEEKGLVSLEDCYFWKAQDGSIWHDTPYSYNAAKDFLEELRSCKRLTGTKMAFQYGYFIPPVQWIPYFLYPNQLLEDRLKKILITDLDKATLFNAGTQGYYFDLRACIFSPREVEK